MAPAHPCERIHARGLYVGQRFKGIGRSSRVRCSEKRIDSSPRSSVISSFAITNVSSGISPGAGPQLVDMQLRMLLWRIFGDVVEAGFVFMAPSFLARAWKHQQVRQTRIAATARRRWTLQGAATGLEKTHRDAT